MATPAPAFYKGEKGSEKGSWRSLLLPLLLATLISVVTVLFNDHADINQLKSEVPTKVNKEKYDTDMGYIKDSLSEIKTDVKDIKKENINKR